MQASSAISFRLPPASFSAAASTGSPLPSTFVSGFSGLFRPHLSVPPAHFLTPAVFAFFRPLLFRFQLLRFCAFFSLLPGFPSQLVFPVPVYPPSAEACFHASLPALVLSPTATSFHRSPVSRHSRYTASDSLSFRLQPFPVVITLGSGYSAWALHPEN